MTRTQQQRRAETVARLIDVGIDTIIELGYARASAAVIAKLEPGVVLKLSECNGNWCQAETGGVSGWKDGMQTAYHEKTCTCLFCLAGCFDPGLGSALQR